MNSVSRFMLLGLMGICMTGVGLSRGNGESASSSSDGLAREKSITKIVSLSPGITETIYALGFGDKLVGRTEYCDYPPEALKLPTVGSIVQPNVEAIMGLAPDLIIASTHFPEDTISLYAAVGLNLVIFKGPDSFNGTYDGIILPVAEICGNRRAGEELVERMERTRLDALSQVKQFISTPKVYYVISYGKGGDWTAGRDTFIGDMIHQAGGINIANDIFGWAYSLESLVEADPDIIILPAWAMEGFHQTPIYSELRAVKNGHLFEIDVNIITRQGPRLAEGFVALVDIIGSVF